MSEYFCHAKIMTQIARKTSIIHLKKQFFKKPEWISKLRIVKLLERNFSEQKPLKNWETLIDFIQTSFSSGTIGQIINKLQNLKNWLIEPRFYMNPSNIWVSKYLSTSTITEKGLHKLKTFSMQFGFYASYFKFSLKSARYIVKEPNKYNFLLAQYEIR